MRADNLTTKFQEALADAQSLANVSDNAYMEPQHLLVALLRQDDGPKSLLQRAGVNVAGLLKAAEDSLQRLPQVQGGEQVQPSRDLFAKILSAEEEHVDFIETQKTMIEQMGLHNYIQLQSCPAGS